MSTTTPVRRERCQACDREDRSLAVNKKGQAFMIYVAHGLCQLCRLRRIRHAA